MIRILSASLQTQKDKQPCLLSLSFCHPFCLSYFTSTNSCFPKTQEKKLITFAFFVLPRFHQEDCAVQNVWLMGGLSVLTSVPTTPQPVCLLCASKGRHEVRQLWSWNRHSSLIPKPNVSANDNIFKAKLVFICVSLFHQMIFCQICCEPFHSFCLSPEERPVKDNKENWCCRRCKFCHVCGRRSKSTKVCKPASLVMLNQCSSPRCV